MQRVNFVHTRHFLDKSWKLSRQFCVVYEVGSQNNIIMDLVIKLNSWNNPHPSIGQSPASLMLGRQIKTKIPQFISEGEVHE